MEWHVYIVTVKHDSGRKTIKLGATSIAQAVEIIMAREGCPARAVIAVRRGKLVAQAA
jgi:hypothetical protein